MATVLDVGLLGYFDVVLTFLFVFALVFAILQKTKAITDNAAINSIIGIVAGGLVIISDPLVQVVNFMLPWFVIVIIFFVSLLLIFRVFGATDEMFSNVIKNDKAVIWGILGVGIIIFLAAIGSVIGQSFTEAAFDGQSGSSSTGTNISASNDGSTTTTSFEGNLRNIFFNTKVLGMMLIFGIAVFAIAFLSGNTAP